MVIGTYKNKNTGYKVVVLNIDDTEDLVYYRACGMYGPQYVKNIKQFKEDYEMMV